MFNAPRSSIKPESAPDPISIYTDGQTDGS